jgi:hypothetical protein
MPSELRPNPSVFRTEADFSRSVADDRSNQIPEALVTSSPIDGEAYEHVQATNYAVDLGSYGD